MLFEYRISTESLVSFLTARTETLDAMPLTSANDHEASKEVKTNDGIAASPLPGLGDAQDYHLIWLDANIDESNSEDSRRTLAHLRQVAHHMEVFIDSDQCLEFISDNEDKKIFIIVSGSLGQEFVPKIGGMPQIDSICIFCQNGPKHKLWARQWPKVKGVFTRISPICNVFQEHVKHSNQNMLSISFISNNDELSSQSLDQIDQSFMYTQILKEILLTIDFDQQSIHDFTVHCRDKFADKTLELHSIDELEKEYHQHTPIWWYTYECFLYAMLNQALRTMEVDTIIRMGFFLRALHENIASLHAKQYGGQHHRASFVIYRGQCMTNVDFEQLRKAQGGLLSFNSFLSTSKKRHVSRRYARRSLLASDTTGVLFVITVHPSLSSTPFANIENHSCYRTEGEILFSMHSVFRIGHIKPIKSDKDHLWEVELTLTSDDDPQRRALSSKIREETQEWTGWHRLARLLIMLGQHTKAEDLYKVLIDQTHDDGEKAHYHHHLGVVSDGQGKYETAVDYYRTSMEINARLLCPEHPNLAISYIGLGSTYAKMGLYAEALSCHQRARDIFEKHFTSKNRYLAISHGNIGRVYYQMGDYARALSSHTQALDLFHAIFPPHLSDMGACYCDIGNVYFKMDDYSKALSSHEKAMAIRQKCLPSNHPLLAVSYHHVGEVHVKMGQHATGLAWMERAMDLGQRVLSTGHPDLELYRNSLDACRRTSGMEDCQSTSL